MEADLRRIEALGGEEAPSAANLRREAVSRVAGTLYPAPNPIYGLIIRIKAIFSSG